MCQLIVSLYVCMDVVHLPNTTYTLQINGQDEVPIGMDLAIQCMIMESGVTVETSDVQLVLILPNGEVIINREFNTIATLEHNGTYSCIALLNNIPTVASLSVIVYGK